MENIARNEVHKGFTEDELRAAFDKIANPDDWKDEIAVAMPGECVMLAVAAIEFYTATNPKVSLAIGSKMTYVVTSEGYRAGPAGDH